MSFVGDKGQEIYLTFDWQTVQVGTGDTARNISEKEILGRVPGKYKAHVEAKKNPIMAVVQFAWRWQLPGETFDIFVTDLKLLARGLAITETEKLIWNTIACKSLDDQVRQCCLEKSKHLSLESAIDIGWMFEATKDGIQVMAKENPRVADNTVTSKPGPSKRCRNQKKYKLPPETSDQMWKVWLSCPQATREMSNQEWTLQQM